MGRTRRVGPFEQQNLFDSGTEPRSVKIAPYISNFGDINVEGSIFFYLDANDCPIAALRAVYASACFFVSGHPFVVSEATGFVRATAQIC